MSIPPPPPFSTRPSVGLEHDRPGPTVDAVMTGPAPLPPPLNSSAAPSVRPGGPALQAAPVIPAAARAYGNPPRDDVAPFVFDGGAATFLGIWILCIVLTVCTLGLCFPFAVVLKERWRAHHTLIEGRRLEFTGSAVGLFFRWLVWELLIVVTLGVYSLWVVPRMTRWRVEHLVFERA